jgi:hypothetical protein
MCCLLSALVVIGARGVLFLVWLFQPVRWNAAFDGFSILVPLLGFLFLPWTTLMYVLVAPGGVDTVDAIGLVLALVLDIGSYAAGGVSGRNRYAQTSY